MGLSPPTSSVRITSGRAAEQVRDLLVTSAAARLRRAPSRDRGTGTRCAAGRSPRRPAPRARRVSAAVPARLANTSMRSPLASRQDSAAAASSRACAFARLREARARRGQLSASGRGEELARLGVEDDLAPAVTSRTPAPEAHQHGHAQRRGEDGHVRSRAAGQRARCPPSRAASRSMQLRGREVAGHQDAAVGDVAPLGARRPRVRAAPGVRDRRRSAARSMSRASPVAAQCRRRFARGWRARRRPRSCRRAIAARARIRAAADRRATPGARP